MAHYLMRALVTVCCVSTLRVMASPPTEGIRVPRWSGAGHFRVQVQVPAISGLAGPDELIAECDLPLREWLQKLQVDGSVDLGSFQIHRYDPVSGNPMVGPKLESSSSSFDLPCRFEDDRYPCQHPSRVGRASETADGRAALVMRDREARLFNREHSNERGRLVWAHRQDDAKPSYYAIYFDVLPSKRSWGVPAAPWLGDGAPLRRESDQPLGGFAHFTAASGDLNGDGLFDIIAGNEKGDMFWFPNRGGPNQPHFLGCLLLEDEAGPIDTGWYAAPVVCDWNGDGLMDLLVGTSGNVILWWRNEGSETVPDFRYMGFVQADGKRLELPESPVAEDAHGIFARDYFNQPWVGDLNDDGELDLVTGGYTTGQIFWYRGQSRDEFGAPKLQYMGPLLDADEKPLDTIWAAAPALADFDGDKRLDLVTGAWRWSGIHGAPHPGETDVLWYYRGTGTEENPRYLRAAFPGVGDFPQASIARPNVVDANGDGLLDLFTSECGGNAYIFLNEGSKLSPRWNLRPPPLTAPWGFARDFDVAASMADVNADGSLDFLVGNLLTSITGSAASPHMQTLGVAHVNGKPLSHSGPGYGDPYYFSILHDWDGDGHADILWGTQQGNIFLHRNLVLDDPLAFAEGIELKLLDGEPLRVGPPVAKSAAEASDFTILQGSRIVVSVTDFDADGLTDLVVGDTFANVWVFRGSKQGATDALHPGVLLTKLETRPEAVTCADWNHDGLPDLLIGGTATDPCIIYYNSSQPGKPKVESRKAVAGLPYLFWGPKLRAADWNGDGDVDLLVQSEFFSFWLERSFLDHGYQVAIVRASPDGAPLLEQKSSAERSP